MKLQLQDDSYLEFVVKNTCENNNIEYNKEMAQEVFSSLYKDEKAIGDLIDSMEDKKITDKTEELYGCKWPKMDLKIHNDSLDFKLEGIKYRITLAASKNDTFKLVEEHIRSSYPKETDGLTLLSTQIMSEVKSHYQVGDIVIFNMRFHDGNNKGSDAVNSPQHYKSTSGLQAIDVIDGFKLNFNLGNVVKYVLRSGKKDPSKTKEDLKKALYYLSREIGE